jgi:hypothetical protein
MNETRQALATLDRALLQVALSNQSMMDPTGIQG